MHLVPQSVQVRVLLLVLVLVLVLELLVVLELALEVGPRRVEGLEAWQDLLEGWEDLAEGLAPGRRRVLRRKLPRQCSQHNQPQQ